MCLYDKLHVALSSVNTNKSVELTFYYYKLIEEMPNLRIQLM